MGELLLLCDPGGRILLVPIREDMCVFGLEQLNPMSPVLDLQLAAA